MSADYDVGYRKPPKDTRFKQGQSGNPSGRPKGTLNLRTDLLEELGEQILVREGSRELQISKQRAMVKNLMAKAVQGNDRAARTVLELIYRYLPLDELETTDAPISKDEKAILENFQSRILSEVQLRKTQAEPTGEASDD